MFSEADIKIIILIMLMAVIVAVAGALAYWFILTRDPYPEGTYELLVGDTLILVESKPNLQVKLVNTPPADEAVAEEAVQAPQEGGEQTDGSGENLSPPDANQQIQSDGGTGTGEGGAQPQAQSPPPTAVPTPIPRPPQVLIESYQVPPGETLYGITTKRNTTIALMARYGISASDVVPGTVIPVAVANPNYCSGSFPYIVRENDTLSTIAIKCNTTVATLKQLNGFGENYRLDVTAVICVPNPP
jgi:LysM repeat protein